MVTVYTIIINNDSGEDRKYALFTEPPQVAAGGIKPVIWSNVFGRANAAHGTKTEFKVTRQYYAVFGSSSGTPGEGVDVLVSGTKKVDLGKLNKDKTEVKGTTLNYVVKDGIPQFDDGEHPNEGQVQAFNITTDEFNAAEAKKERFFIGLAGSAQGIGPNAGPSAIFVPEPNADYQIQPSAKFYIAFGDFKEGEIIDYVKKSKNACLVDFTKLDHAGTTEVIINHDTDNIMTIQADP